LSEPEEKKNGEPGPEAADDDPEPKSVSEILDSPETELFWKPAGLKLKKKRRGLKVAVIVLVAAVAAYVVYRKIDLARKNYTTIITPAGDVKVYHGRGASLGSEFVEIELDELNDLIAGFSPEAAENKFGAEFLENARRRLKEKGFALARPGEKPDPEKALAIVEALLYGQADLFADGKLDADGDGKPEYATYEELKRKELAEYLPVEVGREPSFQGYRFELRLGETADERERGFVVVASPVAGKGRFYYADQTGVIRSETDRAATGKSPRLKKIDLD